MRTAMENDLMLSRRSATKSRGHRSKELSLQNPADDSGTLLYVISKSGRLSFVRHASEIEDWPSICKNTFWPRRCNRSVTLLILGLYSTASRVWQIVQLDSEAFAWTRRCTFCHPLKAIEGEAWRIIPAP